MKLRDVLCERITSGRVLNRHDMTVILDLVKKEFGMDYDTNSSIGLCLISQITFSIAALAGVDDKALASYVTKISNKHSGDDFNRLEKVLEIFNSTPMRVGKKWVKFQVSAKMVESVDDMKRELAYGQPIICALPTSGTLGMCLHAIEMVSSFRDRTNEYVPPLFRKMISGGWVSEAVETDVKNGFVSRAVWDAALKRKKFPFNDDGGSVYHTVLCFGYDGGDRAFLFRDARDEYARDGYFKVSEDVLKKSGTGLGKRTFHGMFYVELISKEAVANPEKSGK